MNTATATPSDNNDLLVNPTLSPATNVTSWAKGESTTSRFLSAIAAGLDRSTYATSDVQSYNEPTKGAFETGGFGNISFGGLNIDERAVTISTLISTSATDLRNGSDNNSTGYQFRQYFCPAIYDFQKCQQLNDTVDPLHKCEIPGLAFLYGIFVVTVGITAIFGNAVLPIVVWRRRSMRTKQNYIKVSLCFNDMITGFLLLCSVLPNMIWFRNSTKAEVLQGMVSMYNSPAAIIAASALIITLQGSLFHLMYLSADRYFAIKWPIQNRRRKRSTVLWMCTGIWLLTFIGSAVTVGLKRYYNFLYNPLVFMYTLGYEASLPSRLHGYLHYSIALFVPYVATIILTVLTGIWAFRKLRSSTKMLQSKRTKPADCLTDNGSSACKDVLLVYRDSSRRSEKFRRPQWALVKTIMIMTGAFVVAWSIFFILFFMSVAEEASGVVYLVSFSAALSNSVANVIIYSLKDDTFRVAVKATFLSKKRLRQRNGATTVRRAADFQMRSSEFERRSSNAEFERRSINTEFERRRSSNAGFERRCSYAGFERKSSNAGFERKSSNAGFERRSSNAGFERKSSNAGFERRSSNA